MKKVCEVGKDMIKNMEGKDNWPYLREIMTKIKKKKKEKRGLFPVLSLIHDLYFIEQFIPL